MAAVKELSRPTTITITLKKKERPVDRLWWSRSCEDDTKEICDLSNDHDQ